MSVRMKIWSLPVVATIIFAIGTLIVLFLSTTTLGTIRQIGESRYPYLDATTRFSSQLDLLMATIQGAVTEGDKKRLDEAVETANQMRATLKGAAGLAGHADQVGVLSNDFEAYFVAAIDTAQLFLGVTKGDGPATIPKMQAAQKKLEAMLAQ